MKEKIGTRANIQGTHAIQQGSTQFKRQHPASAGTHPLTREESHERQTQQCPHSTCTVELHLSERWISGSAWRILPN
jgi:hypothetical protein